MIAKRYSETTACGFRAARQYQGTSFASGLALSKNGDTLYVANRLHNSIAQFSVGAGGELRPVAETRTRGDYPRSLALSPDGRYLYALNQRSDNVTRFSVNPTDGKLSFVGGYLPIGSPRKWRSCRRRSNPWPARFTGRVA